jgi:hypothetical protein
MFGEFQFDLSGTNSILLIAIVGISLVLFYFEIRKIKIQIQEINQRVEQLSKKNNPKVDIITKENEGNILKPFPLNTNIQFPITQPMNEQMNESMNEQMNESMNEQMNEQMNESMNEQMNESMNEPRLGSMTNAVVPEFEESSQNIEDRILYSEEENDNEKDNGLNNDLDNESDNDIESWINSGVVSEEESDEESDKGSYKDSDEESCGIPGTDFESEKDISPQSIDYTKCTVNELKSILSELNLPLSGNKTKLIQRIKDNK